MRKFEYTDEEAVKAVVDYIQTNEHLQAHPVEVMQEDASPVGLFYHYVAVEIDGVLKVYEFSVRKTSGDVTINPMPEANWERGQGRKIG